MANLNVYTRTWIASVLRAQAHLFRSRSFYISVFSLNFASVFNDLAKYLGAIRTIDATRLG